MRKFRYTAPIVLLFLMACTRGELYNQRLKTLDSLNGALNLKVRELEKADTALLLRCITRFNYYSRFIKQNFSDTLTKTEADNLQHFLVAGKNLESFRSNRLTLLGRASLINSQQNHLNQDIKNHAIEIAEADRYLAREKEVATQLINNTTAQQHVFFSGVEEFRNSLRGVESLIKARNNGLLPTIVRDTLAL